MQDAAAHGWTQQEYNNKMLQRMAAGAGIDSAAGLLSDQALASVLDGDTQRVVPRLPG